MSAFPKTATCVPAADRKIPKMSGLGACWCGRRGMPREWIDLMYADYQSGLSLAEVAAKYDRTRQALFDIFKRRGLKLRAKNFQPVIEYKGRRFTSQKVCGRHKYLRDTIHRQPPYYLHHIIWIEHNGPIPRGHKVVFKDGNHLNCDISNLELLTNSDQVKRHATGANQFTKVAKQKLGLMLSSHQSGSRSTLAAIAGGGR